MAIIVIVFWLGLSEIEYKFYPDTFKACTFVEENPGLKYIDVLATVTELKGNVYRTSAYRIDCKKLNR